MPEQSDTGGNHERRAVYIDAGQATELLEDGETTATIIEGDGDSPERNEVYLINVDGGTQPSTNRIDVVCKTVRKLHPVGVVIALSAAALVTLSDAMAINVESVMFGVAGLFTLVVCLLLALPYLPRKLHGRIA